MPLFRAYTFLVQSRCDQGRNSRNYVLCEPFMPPFMDTTDRVFAYVRDESPTFHLIRSQAQIYVLNDNGQVYHKNRMLHPCGVRAPAFILDLERSRQHELSTIPKSLKQHGQLSRHQF